MILAPFHNLLRDSVTYTLHAFNKTEFLKHYWQKKPLVIRNGFLDFIDPINENELAGLAQEDGIDSRIISRTDQNWSLSHGPFDSFEEVCSGAWSLLVQSVDTYIKEAKQLLDSFDFIPQWRTDDLMVSYSVEDAGVGPHLDQYDVFIIQGMGSRRWQVGNKQNYDSLFPTTGLTQVAKFSPIIDEVLLPGDIIYIPPGFPHNGVAMEPCLNYSVGFRAPTQMQLLNGFADFVQSNELFNNRYSDPDLKTRSNSLEMNANEKQRFREMFQQMINSHHFDDFIGEFFTDNNESTGYDTDQEENYSEQDIAQALQNGTCFYPELNHKAMQSTRTFNKLNQIDTWINQVKISVLEREKSLLNNMLSADCLDVNQKIYHENSLFFVQILTKLVNTGAWYPENEHT